MDNFRQTRRPVRRQTTEGFLATAAGRPGGVLAARPDTTSVAPAEPESLSALGPKPETAPPELPSNPDNSEANIKLDLGLPGEAVESHPKRHMVWRKQWSAVRRWTFRTAAIMLAVIIGVGGFLFAEGYMKLHKVFNGGGNAVSLQKNVDPNLLKGEGDGRVNILLLGIGGPGHDGSDLTDTMMLASIDPVNNKVALLSIPRDLWVKMPNNFVGNYQKINAAYEAGKYEYLGRIDASSSNTKAVEAGFQAADGVVSQVLGVPIHYNVLVNFQAFRQAVDTVGGVTVNVPTELYDPTMAWENHGSPILAEPGVQTFDGPKALRYVRSRETTSDFARTQRQRAVLLALKDKVMTLGTLSNPIKISNLMSAFGNNVVTDFSLSDMSRLYSLVKGITNTNVTSLGLADKPNDFVTTGSLNGLSIVKPRAGLFDYSEIQAYVRSQLKDGYIVKENARVEVLNGTSQPGLADTEAAELKTYGYNVVKVGNASTANHGQTVLVDLTNGKDKYTKHYLEQRLGTTAVSQVPDPTINTQGVDLVIILGNDEIINSQT
ncbi:MAG TPA: LCP family protein [Candidatus Saccharimonadales bacterium]|nr:LCP family protein [Candidatus Saccharimonadales bacterium]